MSEPRTALAYSRIARETLLRLLQPFWRREKLELPDPSALFLANNGKSFSTEPLPFPPSVVGASFKIHSEA